MSVLIVCIVAVLLWQCHTLRQFVLHPLRFAYYLVKDAVLYVVHKERNRCPTGQINAYVAHFGRGKTLSATAYITSLYRRYNGKQVWDDSQHRMVTQQVEILSNVQFMHVPSVPLVALSDIVARAEHNKAIDQAQHTLTVTLVLLDESGAQLNSREYRNNFDADTLNALVTCRHYHLSVYHTTQKFKLADALLRSITQGVVKCHKFWRIQKLYYYDADQVELAGDTALVKPLCVRSFFVTDSHYSNYDTLDVVDKLIKDAKAGKMMSAQEILAARGAAAANVDAVTSPSRQLRRMMRRRSKR